MHKTNIETLRDEAQRQLHLLKDLLQKSEQKGLVNAPAKDEKEQATFDTKSLPKVLEVLDGESHKLNNLDMVLAVVGTMKAGKSTTINAIVGAEVLPNRNRPMTALPTLIRHTPGVLQPKLIFEKVEPLNDLLAGLGQAVSTADPENIQDLARDVDMAELLDRVRKNSPFVSRHEGEQAIFQFLKSLNDLVRLCFHLDMDFPFTEYATVDAMPVIEVEFSHLKNMPSTQGRLTLLDTPGPNEAGQQHLRDMLKDQLKKASAVLAVLDYTQLKSDADAQVRESLLEISATAKDRMYAMVNKFDQKDRNSDDEDTVKKYVAQTLMKGEISKEKVFPVSANQGYLASRARNEIDRSGQLEINQSWVKDFAEEVFGRRWKNCIENFEDVNEGADLLWRDSGFAIPLEQVIVEAHQNAALEALRSATSKLIQTAEDAGDFFKVNVRALQDSTESLQEKIKILQGEIDKITKTESEIEKKLQNTLIEIKKEIQSDAELVKEDIARTLNTYLEQGRIIQKETEEENQKIKKEIEEKQKRSQSDPFFRLRSTLAGTAAINATISAMNNSSSGKNEKTQTAFINAKNNEGIITTNEKWKFNEFRNEIEKSIHSIFQIAEKDIQNCIAKRISKFNEELNQQRFNSLEQIQKSMEKNLEGFNIEIKLPKSTKISLNISITRFLENSLQEKTKSVTRHRRQSGAWGSVCSLFGTDDWGWETYEVREDYFEVNLNVIRDSSLKGVDHLFESSRAVLDKEIYPQLQDVTEDFFKSLREKIQHIRGDLIGNIEKSQLDENQKKIILNEVSQMAHAASNLVQDCTALNYFAEKLRQAKNPPMIQGEVLA